jgi:hypothetical protein
MLSASTSRRKFARVSTVVDIAPATSGFFKLELDLLAHRRK